MQRILVIDDDDELRSDVIDILKFKGFITEGAINGKLGLQAVKDFHPNLILCDVDMPDLNGYEVLDSLNQDPDFQDITFIFLTGASSMENLRKGMNLGADDYLTKPLQIDDLLKAIATRLKKNENQIHQKVKKLTPEGQTSERIRLTPRQNRIVKLVNQGTSLTEIANSLEVSLDAAEILEDIVIRLNHRLELNTQLDKPQIQEPNQENHHVIHEEKLTPRQLEILRLVANGMTTKEIAEALFISVKTVETHRGQLMERLHIHDLAGLIRYALRIGLINLED